jgi:prolyl-tRNA synthetase
MGRRATDWELKGVPVRLELGPRDLAEDVVTVVRRVTGSKAAHPLGGAVATVRVALDEQQRELLVGATERREARTADVATIDEAVEAAATGWARIPFAAVGEEGENALAEHAVTVRCLVRPDGGVPDGDDEPDLVAVVARAY